MIGALMRLMELPHWVPPLNLGNDSELSMRELANTILELTGARAGLEYLPLPADDPARRRPDISRAVGLLGWRPQVDVRTGLDHTLRYFAQRHAQRCGNGSARTRLPPRANGPAGLRPVTEA